jgi:hypothetical protein
MELAGLEPAVRSLMTSAVDAGSAGVGRCGRDGEANVAKSSCSAKQSGLRDGVGGTCQCANQPLLVAERLSLE